MFHAGLPSFTSPRTAYNATGVAISFGGTYPQWSTHIALFVYDGVALVAIDGSNSGPFIELAAGTNLDLHVRTSAVYVKSASASLSTEVGLVATLDPHGVLP